MPDWIHFDGEQRALHLFGVKMVGMNAENLNKLLITIVLILIFWIIGRALNVFTHLLRKKNQRVAFWLKQVLRVFLTGLLAMVLLSLWFNEPSRLAAALGLFSAGLAFALQKVVTSIAGYFVILRGNTFNVGDRITMGGVRGDVIALNFIQTTIMEMGQPPSVQTAEPAMWVRSRQYTGRLVKISNDKIFDHPVFNYTKEFPYIWEEMTLPVSYKDDPKKGEEILLAAAEKHTARIQEVSAEDLKEIERRYAIAKTEIKPRVYWRLTDNWIELSLRFITANQDIREIKDVMSREILQNLKEAGMGVGSTTIEVVSLPDLKMRNMPHY
jgi:small-conductance mechanosensitive channel